MTDSNQSPSPKIDPSKEVRSLIQRAGPITFSQYMQACLYSSQGGFYSSRENRINTHFGTSPTSHPVFGTLVARQLEQMWQILERPSVFQVIEVGSGDGALARSIVDAAQLMDSGIADALYYVATDYEPWWPESLDNILGWDGRNQGSRPHGREISWGIDRVKAEGVAPFKNIVGCILCNELLDNFPVHRFVIDEGVIKEVYVTDTGEGFEEILGTPSTPEIEQRLASLGLSLPEGYRGEVNLGLGPWVDQIIESLDRGFVLTIDYGELAKDLYSAQHVGGTLICYNRHTSNANPYQAIGSQDITSLVDFTSLMKAGEERGLSTVGYTLQRYFLANLGFTSFLDSLDAQGLSYARTELSRMAMATLVDPEEYGDFKVLVQSKGIGKNAQLFGLEK